MDSRYFFCALAASFFVVSAQAEELHGVRAADILGDVKKKFPNATFTRIKAAWVTSDSDFFSMSGNGFPGTLYLAFSDERPRYKKEFQETKEPADDNKSAKFDRELLWKWANEGDDEALIVKWVRWAPPDPIPLQRYKSKYGEPTKCDFSDEDMRPYCQWSRHALLAKLTDDQKQVVYVESDFTREELRAAWRRKAGFVPQWLQDAPEKGSTPPDKRQKK
jgi:hypothetical protein